ncbi:MAG: oligoendopeptidase F [Nitrospinae bacterium]|nr:oligoendopeptidase F [Nitrospinota bacterium]
MDAVVELTTREKVSGECTWDLSGLYSSVAAWQADFDSLESEASGYAGYQGALGSSPAALKACLEFDLGISRKLDALYTYAHLRNDEDKTDAANQESFEKASGLYARILKARSFIASELMALPEERMDAMLQDKDLELYKFHLEQILRFRRHTLSPKEEALLAAATEMAKNAQDAFAMLDNADLKLGSVKDETGREIAVTHGNFQSLLQKYDRRARKETFETFYSAYAGHQYTYSSLLAGSVKKDLFFSRARNFGQTRERAMFQENVPAEVYDNLIGTVRAGMAPLYKYFDLRKRILGLDELRVYDCAVPLIKDFHWRMDYEEATGTILDALAPLGGDYRGVLRQGLSRDRWVDRYENKGKRSGAYSSGCYDSHPFILMNFREDNIDSVYTLAHEAGHSMHSYYSRKSLPYVYADYTIFVAEVASTFNEALLTRYLLGRDPDPEMKIYIVSREIDNLRGTLYRQTMFAEFERLVHQAAAGNQPLTADFFKSAYRNLLGDYFGDGVVLDESLALECFRIPHFYSSFYVYKYATGISAAYALADRVLNGGGTELNEYLNFLKSGGSKYPIDLLRDAGIDMTSPRPIEAALKKFSDLVDELEALTVLSGRCAASGGERRA